MGGKARYSAAAPRSSAGAAASGAGWAEKRCSALLGRIAQVTNEPLIG